jgi:hypothetical protein
MAAVLAAVLLPAAAAQADNTACAGAVSISSDGSWQEGVFTGVSQQRWFKFQAFPDRSYALMTENLSPTDQQSGTLFTSPTLATCAGTSGGITNLTLSEPTGWDGTGAGRWAYKSTTATEVFFRVTESGTTPGAFRTRIVETTLVSPLFTTFSNFETFYRFVNTTNQPVSVTLKLISDAGTIVVNDTFTVAANGTAPTRNTGISDYNVADNTAGQAIITYDGTPGAIQIDGFSGNFSVNPPIVLPIKIVPARQQR